MVIFLGEKMQMALSYTHIKCAHSAQCVRASTGSLSRSGVAARGWAQSKGSFTGAEATRPTGPWPGMATWLEEAFNRKRREDPKWTTKEVETYQVNVINYINYIK